ncbi:hypothetical protein BJ508DRAFT_340415 [Ascobolus immersus RN42]|uniref:Uncharacterized protein n=1 Tax=Ascobolus immersus RN42 TaxID=1160509 RepID=A0A3N4IE65_ASCIM|nr:hypothetical protein BJ508DRAFT_340415 [Ascobolus immersus RN42]
MPLLSKLASSFTMCSLAMRSTIGSQRLSSTNMGMGASAARNTKILQSNAHRRALTSKKILKMATWFGSVFILLHVCMDMQMRYTVAWDQLFPERRKDGKLENSGRTDLKDSAKTGSKDSSNGMIVKLGQNIENLRHSLLGHFQTSWKVLSSLYASNLTKEEMHITARRLKRKLRILFPRAIWRAQRKQRDLEMRIRMEKRRGTQLLRSTPASTSTTRKRSRVYRLQWR